MRPGDVLLIVDVQNDFCPGGSLAVAGGDEVAAVLTEYAQRFHATGLPVVATRDWHPANTVHFNTGGGTWPPHCIRGTWGGELHAGLHLPESALLLSKGMDPNEDGYSGWAARDESGRSLVSILQRLGVRRLLLGGLATDYCVAATAKDALAAGFQVQVLTEAVRPVELQPGDGERALAEMRAAGAVTATLGEVD